MTESRIDLSRRWIPVLSILLGAGLAVAFHMLASGPVLRDSLVYRYFCDHPIKIITTGLFFWGVAVLGLKLLWLSGERRALGRQLLPNRARIAITDVSGLINQMAALQAGVRSSMLGRRLREALDYVSSRGSAEGLENRLDVIADREADELDGSYELVRTITWAIPILGFLGTVLGITQAIGNITVEQLKDSLDDVIAGLAVAFDTTALALALSMVIVLIKFLVERAELGVLNRVTQRVEDELLHRFEVRDPDTARFLLELKDVADVVMRSTREAWREQGEQWCRALKQVGAEHVQRIDSLLEQVRLALDAERQQWLLGMRENLAAVTALSESLGRQTGLLDQLVQDGAALTHLQKSLNDNLDALSSLQALDETIHSLAAAVHLLTARAGRQDSTGAAWRGSREAAA